MTDHLAPYAARVQAIDALAPDLAAASDQALSRRVSSLRQRVRAASDVEDLPVETVTEAFALAGEASRRILGLTPYEVQIAGGLALWEGKVVEMATGEGKTLAAVAPVALVALAGRGAHVLTFNDYLARRDAAWMGPVYERLGLSVGVVQERMSAAERHAAYHCDVTYLTAREAGFDFLRDGLRLDRAEQVHRPFHFALIDEADSILIDEARIPLVIAGAVEQQATELGRLAEIVRELSSGSDYDTDENARNVFLTDAGTDRVEAMLACGSLVAAANAELAASLRNALHAEVLLRRDVDYIVRTGAVELVDELTGRVAENRQWPDGLQAAVQAKEGLRLGADGRLLCSVTLQHLLALYPRLAGMTATARSSEDELEELYGLEVVEIAAHRPCVRDDREDRIYGHLAARDRAIVGEIVCVHATGRPILVGTASVAESERLAAALARVGVVCRVLNAKNDEDEAAVVAEAGALGAVTISTNMAGRGTDIRLGGRSGAHRDEVVALGGLYVIGTHRHESRRIDRQLRGRAGRQGDPGSSRFFLSLEDDLLRRYGIDDLIPRKLLPRGGEEPIESKTVRREVARAQRIVEGQCFDLRRRLFHFSEIVEKQRRYVQEWRQSLLEGRVEPEVLAERCGSRRRELVERLGGEAVGAIERRLAMIVLDRSWSDYLTEMTRLRDEIHFVSLDGREPLAEFYRTAISAFETLLERVDAELVEAFDVLEVGPDGVDWEGQGLTAPAATWTYLVNDSVYGDNVMRTLSTRASIGLWGVLLLWWVLIPWGFYEHWKRRRKTRST